MRTENQEPRTSAFYADCTFTNDLGLLYPCQRGHIRLRYRFFSPGGLSAEAAIQAVMPVEALGWR